MREKGREVLEEEERGREGGRELEIILTTKFWICSGPAIPSRIASAA
jgi:hypothetical protein